ncbi:DUF2203 domain-containing protein [Bacillaceae bacterium]
MAEKYFTVREANALLPRLKEELTSLQKLKREMDDKFRELQYLKAAIANGSQTVSPGEDPFFKLEAELDFLLMIAQGHIERIQETGAQLKDIELGLIDFPALLHGQEILLCWKQGEEEITHWHTVWEGFMGRRKIDPELDGDIL